MLQGLIKGHSVTDPPVLPRPYWGSHRGHTKRGGVG